MSVRDESKRGHRKVSYGLSGPPGLSPVWIRSVSKAPPNGTALAVGKCPRKNPCNCPTDQSRADGLHLVPEGSATSQVLSDHKQPGEAVPAPKPPGDTLWCPSYVRRAGLTLTYCIKYIIWLKNCFVKIKFKSPCRSM